MLIVYALMSTLSTQFANLSVAQQDYFYHLSSGTDSTVFDYFEKVPAELRDDPTMVDQYLNGDPELGIPDRDWSHVESAHNGGSNEADNGFFEDMSTNRSRGPADITPEEAYAAAEESEEDAHTILESAGHVADMTAWGWGMEALTTVAEVSVDCIAPVVGGGLAGKIVADQFTTTKDKLGYGSLATGLTVGFLCTPVGQLCVGGYVGYKVLNRGHKLISRAFSS